ncbi:hypothetical protein DDD63_08315 [Actinobaculum sp. 313]|nr:hypothetical protein DDD63_08315 [Actinobaculum sp. 313]
MRASYYVRNDDSRITHANDYMRNDLPRVAAANERVRNAATNDHMRVAAISDYMCNNLPRITHANDYMRDDHPRITHANDYVRDDHPCIATRLPTHHTCFSCPWLAPRPGHTCLRDAISPIVRTPQSVRVKIPSKRKQNGIAQFKEWRNSADLKRWLFGELIVWTGF